MKQSIFAICVLLCMLCPLVLSACGGSEPIQTTAVSTEATSDSSTGSTSSEPVGGNDSSEPAGGNDSSEPAGGNDSSEPAGGNDSSEPAGGNDSSEPAGGNSSSEPAGGNSSSEPAGGTSEPPQVNNPNNLTYAFDAPQNGTLPATTAGVIASEVDGAETYTSGSTTYHLIHAFSTGKYRLGGITNPKQNGSSTTYYRLDKTVSASYPSAIGNTQAYHLPGVTLRFATDATSIVIDADLQKTVTGLNHITLRGTYGFDVYVGSGTNRTWVASPIGSATSLTQVVRLPSGWKEVLIYFPQYAGVTSMCVGFPTGTRVAPAVARETIAFYGSSITQGAGASRPGNAYTNILGRVLNTDVRNLGFTDAAFGEQAIAEYIAGLSGLSALVIEYDQSHPATAAGQAALEAAHYPFYKTVRDAQPNLPIIFLSRPVYTTTPSAEVLAMRDTVKATYDRAVREGDTNVYFIDGSTFFTDGLADVYTVDNTNPTDSGHYFMAHKIYPTLKAALAK